MTVEQSADGAVGAVVAYDGQLLMVGRPDARTLPCGTPAPGETAGATAARAVYELTGYLVDGAQTLEDEDTALPAVLCQLLSESPSGEGTVPRGEIGWVPFEEAELAGVPEAVRAYLRGHTPT
ncbi:NUDIX domain-containing protein [Streptomyces sp. SID5785]|uniref:NUDIX domain-containing protein n=1 Tax=Streptomyces sp. SID5785 TaxID=2690309 RepID=UPI001360C7C7|nr:NUDIX domain-containing protein [Streptomyces sp. SID5785]